MSPISKRRRLNGGNDEDDSDSSSFASFGSDADQDGGVTGLHPDESKDEGDHETKEADAVPVTSKKPLAPVGKSAKRPSVVPTATARSNGIHTGGQNVFHMQLEQLLQQVRTRRSSLANRAEAVVHEIKAGLESLEAVVPKSVADAERHLITTSGVAIPFPSPRPPRDAQYQLAFEPPARINVTGSYAYQVALNNAPPLAIDVTVEMPASIFQLKDYLDHRYFYKRSYYLGCLAAGLRARVREKYKLSFATQNGNPLMPILRIGARDSSVGAERKGWRISVMPYIDSVVFSDDKMSPAKSSVRLSQNSSAQLGETSSPSSFYNSSLQADRQVTAYLKLIHGACKACDGFKDACILFRIWLRQRGLKSTIQAGGFGNFESTALLAILIDASMASPRYTSYQLFKTGVQFLAAKDCLQAAVNLGTGSTFVERMEGVPILWDGARSHNLIFKMSPCSYRTLRSEARATLATLANQDLDALESTFVSKASSAHIKYDLCVLLPSQLISTQDSDDYHVLKSQSKLYSTLRRGLNDRIDNLHLRQDSLSDWELGSARPSWRTKGELYICVVLNPAAASRTVDLGPPAEDKKAASDFREFWGEKAELRRFKDGSILESIVWPTKHSQEQLVYHIIQYLIGRHFDASTAAALVHLGGSTTHTNSLGEGIATFSGVNDAYQTLEANIRGLEDLPLAIRQISAADEQLRFASINPPLSQSRATPRPISVMIQFESSSRWPDDLYAIHRVKAAFLLKMGSSLEAANVEIKARVGLENTDLPAINQAFLDVSYPSPNFIFRIRIYHEREVNIIQALLKDKSTPSPQREEAATALSHHKRIFIVTPAHTALIARNATRFPALSPTIRLSKKWFVAHHLTNHFPAPLIELFCLHVFQHPAPYSVPGTAKTGLHRTLNFLSRWDWQSDPLLIPPTADSPPQMNGTADGTSVPQSREAWLSAARTRFTAWRKLDPALNRVVLFVASEADPEGTTFSDVGTGVGPARVAASRMSALAAAAVREMVEDERGFRPDTLFVSGLGDFDFVLHLDPVVVGKGGRRRKSKYKNLEEGTVGEEEVGFDGVEIFLGEVRSLYAGSLVLFYGGQESAVVGGLWNPATTKRAWKVGLGYSTVPVAGDEDSAEAVIDKDGILAEIARLGSDMLVRIDRH